jgi:hypothetical protein
VFNVPFVVASPKINLIEKTIIGVVKVGLNIPFDEKEHYPKKDCWNEDQWLDVTNC